MTNNCFPILKTQVAHPDKASSGDAVKMSITLIGTGPLDDPCTSVSIMCKFWVKVLDKPPDKNWRFVGSKKNGGYLAPIFSVAYQKSERSFSKNNKEIKLNNQEKLIQMIDEALQTCHTKEKELVSST